jgi:hypothetical protein
MEQPVVEDDGVRRRTNGRMTADIWRPGVTVLHCPPCRSALAPFDLRLFPKLQKHLRARHHALDDEVKTTAYIFFRLLRCNIFYWPTYESAWTLAQVCRLHQRWICGELEAKKEFLELSYLRLFKYVYSLPHKNIRDISSSPLPHISLFSSPLCVLHTSHIALIW